MDNPPSKDFFTQYLRAQEGTAVPKRFHLWCAIFTMQTTIGIKVFIDHGHFRVNPGILICLIGNPAIKKNTAMNPSLNMLMEALPNLPIGSSITSPSSITKFMAGPDTLLSFIDEGGVSVEWHPVASFVYEFSNYLEWNPQAMIEFLTAIYDVRFYKYASESGGKHYIKNPFYALLAGTTPDKVANLMKASLVGGGFSRRMIFVYERYKPKPEDRVTFPYKSDESKAAEAWCIDHLKKVNGIVGPLQWAEGCREWFHSWNISRPSSDDPILEGYFESKDIIAQRLAICLCMAMDPPTMILTQNILEEAIKILEANEESLYHLTLSSGTNPLSVPQIKLVAWLESMGNDVTEVQFHKRASIDMTENEYASVKKMLLETGQIEQYAGEVGEGENKKMVPRIRRIKGDVTL